MTIGGIDSEVNMDGLQRVQGLRPIGITNGTLRAAKSV